MESVYLPIDDKIVELKGFHTKYIDPVFWKCQPKWFPMESESLSKTRWVLRQAPLSIADIGSPIKVYFLLPRSSAKLTLPVIYAILK